MPRHPQTVTIRGVEYSSVHEAAKALGVSYRTVIANRRRGVLDATGTGGTEANKAALRGRLNQIRQSIILETGAGPAARPVEVQGVVYPSRKAAAEVLGVTVQTIIRHIQSGKAKSL